MPFLLREMIGKGRESYPFKTALKGTSKKASHGDFLGLGSARAGVDSRREALGALGIPIDSNKAGLILRWS